MVYCVCSLEPEEGEQQVEALLAREPRFAASRSIAGGNLRASRISSLRRATCAPCPAIGPNRTRKWRASTASLPPVWNRSSRLYPGFPALALLRRALSSFPGDDHAPFGGDERVDGPRIHRGSHEAGRIRGPPRRAYRHGQAQCPSTAALALHLGHRRPAADRPAGPAHRRPDARERDLLRPLRLRGQDRHLRRPLAVRDRAALGGMGRPAARLRLAAPPARRRIRHHARERARAGRRVDFAAGRLRHRGGLAARSRRRGASSHGSLRRRWCCTKPTCASIAASCATSPGRCAICAAPIRHARDGVPRLQAIMALTYAALCMPAQARTLKASTRLLTDELAVRCCPTAGMSAAIPAR